MELLMRAAGLLLCVALAGCEFFRTPTAIEADPDDAIVHAMLRAGSSEATLVLHQVAANGSWHSGGLETTGLSGADVALIADDYRVTLAESPTAVEGCWYPVPTADPATPPVRREGCYGAVLPQPIEAGAAYTLVIRLPDGGTIEGRATVPAVPTILDVLEPRRLESSAAPWRPTTIGIPLRFAARPEPPGIAVRLSGLTAFFAGEPLPGWTCGQGAAGPPVPLPPSDTLWANLWIHPSCAVELNGVRQELMPDSLHAELLVTGHGQAYLEYAALLFEDVADAPRAARGITGAYGVFDAEATARSRITIRLPVGE